jgi:peptidoglycan/xylan/chitin deacetylase (PgdA/CDA1 family)
MYHRVAHEPVDYYSMTVSPANFKAHLDVLIRTRYVLPLDQFVAQFTAGKLRSDAIALTFDDGYVDNLVEAKPLLVTMATPATVFVVSGQIGRPEHFWWDELVRLVLFEDTPRHFELRVGHDVITFDFGNESAARDDGGTPAGSLERRRGALSTLWQLLRILEDKERSSIIKELQSIFASSNHRASLGRAMTADEVRSLTVDGLVTVGAHTVTHPVMAGLGVAACYREGVESKRACEDLIGRPVVAFSYPYGDYDVAACEAAKNAGFHFACSKQAGAVVRHSEIFALPRVYIPNLDGDGFEKVIRAASERAAI